MFPEHLQLICSNPKIQQERTHQLNEDPSSYCSQISALFHSQISHTREHVGKTTSQETCCLAMVFGTKSTHEIDRERQFERLLNQKEADQRAMDRLITELHD